MGGKASKNRPVAYPAGFPGPVGAAPYYGAPVAAPFAAPYAAPFAGPAPFYGAPVAAPLAAPLAAPYPAYPAVGGLYDGFATSAYSSFPATYAAPTTTVLPSAAPFLASSALSAPIVSGPLATSTLASTYEGTYFNSGIVNSGLTLPYTGTLDAYSGYSGLEAFSGLDAFSGYNGYSTLPVTSSFGFPTTTLDSGLLTTSSTIVDPLAYSTFGASVVSAPTAYPTTFQTVY